MRRTFGLLISLLITAHCLGQTANVQDLLTEPAVYRPLTLHMGQLQINPGYELSIGNRKYDPDGEKIDLAGEGTALVRHLYDLGIKYGILEFAEISAGIHYSNMGVRERQVWYFHGNETVYTTEVSEFNGLSDLSLGLSLRLPFDIEFFDLRISAGAMLPVGGFEPDKPTHSVTTLADSASTTTLISYHYNNKTGNGTTLLQLGSGLKFRMNKLAFSGFADYSFGLKEAETFYWESRLYGDQFTYRKVPYTRSQGNTLSYSFIFDYQAIDWFDIYAAAGGSRYWGGWDEEAGVKVGHREKSILSVGFGFEIQVARRLRLVQSMMLPVAGTNELAPLVFYTGASFNFLTR